MYAREDIHLRALCKLILKAKEGKARIGSIENGKSCSCKNDKFNVFYHENF
jgi:hypothetical protein